MPSITERQEDGSLTWAIFRFCCYCLFKQLSLSPAWLCRHGMLFLCQARPCCLTNPSSVLCCALSCTKIRDGLEALSVLASLPDMLTNIDFFYLSILQAVYSSIITCPMLQSLWARPKLLPTFVQHLSQQSPALCSVFSGPWAHINNYSSDDALLQTPTGQLCE